MSTDASLWLKRVEMTEHDEFRQPPGGSERTIFGRVTSKVRTRVAGQIRAVAKQMESSLATIPAGAAVARVVLKDAALAKTHRPSALFEEAGCPIVGVGGFGELLVSVRPSTISGLANAVLTEGTHQGIANISTIKKLEPYTVGTKALNKVKRTLSEKRSATLKLRLFRHHNETIDSALEDALLAELDRLGIANEALDYAQGLAIFRLKEVRLECVEDLGQFVGTQSLGAFPEYHIVRPAAQPVGRLTPVLFPPPQPAQDYPVVGVIDSGVDPTNALLAPWVTARASYVPPADRDHEHGTFVAGLLVHARRLNHNDAGFPVAPCRVVDIVAFPRGGTLGEAELLAILREVVPKYPDVRIWNLSLGGSTPCVDDSFSDLAVALDELQSAYKVTFVLAAGNYGVRPYRAWPLGASLGEADRICGPADSTRALTVGSIAHRDSASSRVRATAPSPFSRRGPGPVYLPKPEVAHYGGNCEAGGAHAQIGVLSVDASGNLAESAENAASRSPKTRHRDHRKRGIVVTENAAS